MLNISTHWRKINMLKNAFLYMLNDNKFLNKYLICFIFVLTVLFCNAFLSSNMFVFKNIVTPILLSIVEFLIFVIILGYRIICVQALKIDNQFHAIPLFKLCNNFIKGFKYQLAVIIFAIPIFYLITGFAILSGTSMIFNNNVYIIFLALAIITLIFYSIYNLLFNIGFINLYVQKNSYLIFYNIKLLLSCIKKNVKRYLSCLLIYCLIPILLMIFNMLTCQTNIILFFIILIVTSLLITYLFFVNNYLIANCITDENIEN